MNGRVSVITGIALGSLALASGPVLAQNAHGDDKGKASEHRESKAGHSHEKAMRHGGKVTMTPHHHFEVLVSDEQARVYVYDDEQAPVDDLEGVAAKMTVTTKDGKLATLPLEYRAPDPEKGRTQGYFCAVHTMDPAGRDMKAIVDVTGLGKEPIQFRTAVTPGHVVSYTCPKGDSGPAEDPGACPACGMRMTRSDHAEHMGESEHAEKSDGEHMGGGHDD